MQDSERNKKIAKDYEVVIERTEFPATGIGQSERGEHRVPGAFPGERVLARGAKRKHGLPTGFLLEVLDTPYTGETLCKDFRLCGGCVSQHLSLEKQRQIKEREVLALFQEKEIPLGQYKGVFGAENKYAYRNKVDFTFGNQVKGGPLHLGFHQKAMRRNVIDTSQCLLVHEDLRTIRDVFAEYFSEQQAPFYDIYTHEGLLRFLLLRRAEFTGEILIVLIISSQEEVDAKELERRLLALSLEGRIKGFLVGIKDSLGNFVDYEQVAYQWGENFIEEQLCGLRFRIYPESFFQTNSAGAQILFEKTLSLLDDGEVLWDLYCGAGTIGQIASKKFKKVIGIELNEVAVEAARQSALRNHIVNCEYIVGDVKEAVEGNIPSPDVVVVDPPRAGLHPKVVQSLLQLLPPKILYISCNPKTQVRDMEQLMASYVVEQSFMVDLYPNTGHVETVVLMSRKG
jgi:23S rRNA (uracil-5-)-methyltransferase RumA